ncbi:MAG TPA: S8 family serine peptidase, partial [Methylomirabilota bacterium]|nr:S8 family serine peptidase [Methylomirabilota bacterium]
MTRRLGKASVGASWALAGGLTGGFFGCDEFSAAEGPPAGRTGARKVRTSDAAVAREIQRQGGVLIADYGGFQLFEVAPETVARLAGRGDLEEVTGQNLIELNAGALDSSAPEVKALRAAVAGTGGSRLHLLQFVGPIKPEWVQAMEASGVRRVTYVPQNAYLVYGDGAALGRLQAWARTSPLVQWEGAYRDEYKIHPRARLVNSAGQQQKPATDLFAIQLLQDPAANAASLRLIDSLKLTPMRKQHRVLDYLNLIVRLPPERIGDVAALPEVVSIQPYFERKKLDERQDQIMAGNLSGAGPFGPGYLAWLASKGFSQAQFSASGFAVDLSDSPIDNGTGTPGHFGLYLSGNSALGSRVVYNRLEGTPNPGSVLQGCDGHGNLNAHIIAGYNDRPAGFPHTDAGGFHYDLGVCPFVKVGSSVLFDTDAFTYPDYGNLQSKAYNNGARISNNSWGADTAGDYDSEAQEYDALVRDAQPAGSTFPVASNQEMVIVFAAGNAGPLSETVGSPGTAKNVLSVGASENVRSLSTANGGVDTAGNDGCSASDTDADSANDVAFFSSRGPCTDGRKKPDLVAPGTHVTGGVAQTSPPPSPGGTGSALACFEASGVCSLPGGGTVGSTRNFFPLGQQFYTTSTGTSHSAPAVAGACALLRQYFINNGLKAPSPAMTKACLMNSARYLNGSGAHDTLWSTSQGMGEVNLGFTLDGVARVLRDETSADKFTATGQTRTFTGSVVDPAKPFRVTLAWTDAPGNTTGNAYNNNLDLVVTVGGVTYKGNVFSGANSVAGGSADPRNNVESVFLPAGVSGNFVVTVTGANINSDGVPNEAPALDQDFALVIYNATQANGPVILAESAAVTAESCLPLNNSLDPNETVTVNFALKNTGTASTLNLVATLQATGGISGVSGPQAFGALSPGGASVSRAFSFTYAGNCNASVDARFLLQDSGTNLGTVSFSLPLGQTITVLTQNFDGVTVPGLPGGWTTTASGGQTPWVTTTAQRDTLPNSAFSTNAASTGINELVSPAFAVTVRDAQLNFRQSYTLNAGTDGGVLEIKIGSGPYSDIISAGGSFITGGYTTTIGSGTTNPLAGRQAWGGSSGGFFTTVVALPAIAQGQNVQLRWRCGTDQSTGAAGWFVDSIAVTGRACCGNPVPLSPLIQPGIIAIASEGCNPANGAADPGETVTVNFGLQNSGSADSTNLVVSLLSTNGVQLPGGPQNYGALVAGGPAIARGFSFKAVASCGATITPILQLQDNGMDLGTVSFTMQLGQLTTVLTQNFDTVSAPALPAGWTTTTSGGQSAWITTATNNDSPPNSAFATDASSAGVNELITPVVSVPNFPVLLTFRNKYNLEADSRSTTAYDGGVLEIKIGAAAFVDIFAAGGGFLSGGYNRVISDTHSNPLAGRQAWSGNSGGFITTTVSLPAAALGQSVQFRWRCGSDTSVGGAGWNIDSVALTARICCGNLVMPVASFDASPSSGGVPLPVTLTDHSTGTITNRAWDFGNGITTNTTGAGVAVVYPVPGTNTVTLTVSGPLGVDSMTRADYIVATNPIAILVSNSFSLAIEGCTNGTIDAGETVTINLGLKNLGSGDTANLVGTLQNSGGVIPVGGPQNYGVIAHGGGSLSRPFTFIATGSCGATNTATLGLQDGSVNLGTVSFNYVVGRTIIFQQNFDGISAPGLPPGWTTSFSNAQTAWVTSVLTNDTAPNSAFSPDGSSVGVNALVSPTIGLPAFPSQLSFRQFYNLEANLPIGYDGGVLEIKIGGGSFTDIVAAGGSFVSGGYVATITNRFNNPLAGRQAWSGNSGGFITTLINLPAGAQGQSIQLRWRCGSDSSTATPGWYVDSVLISGVGCCSYPPVITTQPQSQTVVAGSDAVFSVTSTGTYPLGYQWRFKGTNLPAAFASSYLRPSVQASDVGPYDVLVYNSMGYVTSAVANLNIVSPPILLSPRMQTNGSFSFTLSGSAGFNYLIEATTNLSNWAAVGTISNVTGQVPFAATNSAGYP